MMLGEITAINPSFPQSGAPTITVSGYDKSHRLRTNSPTPRSFKYVNASLMAIASRSRTSSVPIVDPGGRVHESIEQTGSDWALLQELADRNYFQVFVRWDKLYFRFPRPQLEMAVLEWGKNLISFSPETIAVGPARHSGGAELQLQARPDHRLGAAGARGGLRLRGYH